MRWLLGLLITLVVLGSTPAPAQVFQQTAGVVPGRVAKQLGVNFIGDGGPALGGPPGSGLTELGVTNNTSCGIGLTDGPITLSYHQICLGFDVSGNGLISYNSLGGGSLLISINGSVLSFVAGPGSTTVGDVALWGNTLGTMLTDGGHLAAVAFTGAAADLTNGVTGSGPVVLQNAPTLGSPNFTGTVTGNGTIPNAVLVNSSITIAGHVVTLGGTQPIAVGDLTTIGARTILGNTTGSTAAITAGWTPSGDQNKLATVSGTLTNGFCLEGDVNGNIVTTGAPCGSGGGGGVSSIGISVPATSILGVTGSPVTTSGTIGITTTGISGGLLYFSSTSQVASSALLTNHALVLGAGAGAAPSTPVGLGTTTTVLHGNAAGNPSFGAVANADLTNSSITLNAGASTGLTAPGAVALGTTGVIGATTDNLRFGSLTLGGALTSGTRLTVAGAIDFEPGTVTVGVAGPGTIGIWASTNLTGTVVTPLQLAQGYVTPTYYLNCTDSVNAPIVSGNPSDVQCLSVNRHLNNNTSIGSRSTIGVNTLIDGTLGAVAGNNDYVGIENTFIISANQGGNGTTIPDRGDVFAAGIQFDVLSGATFLTSARGYEIDCSARSGSSMTQKTCMLILSYHSDVTHGSSVDAGLQFSTEDSNSHGWNCVICFGGSGWPGTSSGTIIGTNGTVGTSAIGIDLSAATLTGSFVKGNAKIIIANSIETFTNGAGLNFDSGGNGTMFELASSGGTNANHIRINSAVATQDPVINCLGSDTNVRCLIQSQGTRGTRFASAAHGVYFQALQSGASNDNIVTATAASSGSPAIIGFGNLSATGNVSGLIEVQNSGTLQMIAAGVTITGGDLTISNRTVDTGAVHGYACYDSSQRVVEDTVACLVSKMIYKENISELIGSLDSINRLRPVQFEYKPGLGRKGLNYGFIAEEVSSVDPVLSGFDKDGLPRNWDPNGMIALLVSAIQEQQREIDVLKQQKRN